MILQLGFEDRPKTAVGSREREEPQEPGESEETLEEEEEPTPPPAMPETKLPGTFVENN